MKTIKQTYHIHAPLSTVWQALVDPKIIDAWGGGPAKMDEKVSTKFTFWGGEIYGKNIRVIKNKELVQDWFSKGWKQASRVAFTLKQAGTDTELILLHENVPDEEENDIDEGWKVYYLGPLKKYVEKK